MRKCEQQLISGIVNGYNVTTANSFYDSESGNYYLHNNLLANINTKTIVFNMPVIKFWWTTTTRSRVYALLDAYNISREILKDAVKNDVEKLKINL